MAFRAPTRAPIRDQQSPTVVGNEATGIDRVVQSVISTDVTYGGPSRSVTGLCGALVSAGVDVRLVTTFDPASQRISTGISETEILVACKRSSQAGVALSYWRVAAALRRELKDKRSAILHDHGLWLPTNCAAAYMARRAEVPLVISTRGMLSPWCLEHKAHKKRLAWLAYQRAVLSWAKVLHATSEQEVGDLRSVGITGPIALIPNGVEASPFARIHAPKHALFLGRLHPVKALPTLLRAWANVRPAGWTLELAGPCDSAYRGALEAQISAMALDRCVHLSGPVAESDKWLKLQSAGLFILPSHSENFGLVVAEALSSGLPVIATHGTPWSEIEDVGCGWWVGLSAGALEQALIDATNRTESERLAMGRKAQMLALRYSWTTIANEMLNVYRWLIRGGEPPKSVRFS